MTTREFLSLLRGVRKSGTGWSAFCPAHDDQHKPSLSVGEKDGAIGVHCFKGCTAAQIVASKGLTLADLFIEPRRRDLGSNAASRRIVAVYPYADESGAALYEVVRFDPKDFRPRRPDGAWGLGDVRRVLYRLPLLAEARRIYVVEGEKDADALAQLGLAATTSQGGAKSWRAEYAEQVRALAPEDVVVIPDHDEAGEGYANDVARSLIALGVTVRLLRLPDAPERGDVSDWLASGGTLEALTALVEAAPLVTEPAPAALTSVHLSVVVDELLAALERGPLPTLPTPFPSLTRFLNGGLSPGELVYIGAFPGVGKTALLLEFARRAARCAVSTIIFSREMANLAVARRLVAQELRISAAGLKSGVLDDGDRSALLGGAAKLRGLPIWLNQVATTLAELSDEVAHFAVSPALGLVIVDYLQLVRTLGREGRRIEVEAVSAGLKALALRYRVPVVCASSLARGGKGKDGDRAGRRPTVDLLRESGELEHDADIILLLHRAFEATKTECVLAKNRDGRVGDVELLFRPDWVSFDEVAQRDG